MAESLLAEHLGGPDGLPRTRAEWVEAEIRRVILRGELVAGQKLNVAALAETLQVSATPLREALQRLAGNGLITLSPQRGAFVTELTTDDLTDIYNLRLLLEPKAAEEAAQNSTLESRERMRNAHDKAGSLIQASSVPDIIVRENAHRAFHLAVIENSGSPRLLRIMKELLDHSARYRVAVRGRLGSRPEVTDEHAAIAHAVLDGDSALAGRLVREHLNHTYQAALEYIQEQQLMDDRRI